MSRILIVHTQAQLEEASSLVDLLEASLSLPEGSLLASSLPGYALSQRITGNVAPEEFVQRIDEVDSALALVDEASLVDAQLWFDVAALWARGKRVLLLLDGEERRDYVPQQLAGVPAVIRQDRPGMVALIEDLAFDLGLSPRIGKEAQRALEQWSSLPPAPAKQEVPTVRPRSSAAQRAALEPAESVPPPPRVPNEALIASEFEATSALEDDEDPLEVEDDELEPVQLGFEPHHSMVKAALSCEIALEAGRAIGECSFHRDDGADFTAELDGPFGRFVDAAGGNWEDLKRLSDIELWLGTTDNLLQSLPEAQREAAEWYEIGFQYSTLRSIVEHGIPDDPEGRAVCEDLWKQSMAQLRNSAASARVAPREIRKLQSLLENLIGPEPKRDYGNLGRALSELRELAAQADRGELGVGAATG